MTVRLPAIGLDDLFDELEGRKSMGVAANGCDEEGYIDET